MKTIFCDIDGCLIKHQDTYTKDAEAIEGVVSKLKDWDRKGYNIILTTGRRESSRKITELQLSSAGIYYDQLIMGLGPWERIVINDLKPEVEKNTASAINLERNLGIKDLNL